jgi:hypothetical protein
MRNELLQRIDSLEKAAEYLRGRVKELSAISKEKSGSIIAEYSPAPIPLSEYDWRATRYDYDDGDAVGYGETERDAINDLLDKEEQ